MTVSVLQSRNKAVRSATRWRRDKKGGISTTLDAPNMG